MRKPNPFVVSLNQPPKGVHLGQHRRTSPKAHGNPTDGASAGAGGTVVRTSIPSATWRTFNAGSFAPNPGAFARGGGASLVQDLQDAMTKMIRPSFYGMDLAREEPKLASLPYAGIRTGEIIGHRLWWVLPDGLYSLAHHFRWEPGATVEGDLEKVVWSGAFHPPIYGGVYAYANPGIELMAESEGLRQALEYKHRALNLEPLSSSAIGLVRGTVKLWGEVVEHEIGWRAQFAKLASIEEVWMGLGPQVEECIKVLEPYRASLKV